jgi:hypothetical protein
VKSLAELGSLPGKIKVDDARLEPILKPFCNDLNIELSHCEELDALAEARESLMAHMRAGMR